jgi:molybdopterin synthase catalytic subunit
MDTQASVQKIDIRVSDGEIQVEAILKSASAPGWGAEVLFLGAVRDLNLGKSVLAVSYDAFAPHAEATLRDICQEALAKWGPDLGMVVHHRTGKLNVGEISVAIAVGSRHRDEAFQASRYIIEELKERAAIWKKEHYLDGDSEWLKGHALCGHRHSTQSHSELGLS